MATLTVIFAGPKLERSGAWGVSDTGGVWAGSKIEKAGAWGVSDTGALWAGLPFQPARALAIKALASVPPNVALIASFHGLPNFAAQACRYQAQQPILIPAGAYVAPSITTTYYWG